MSTHTPGPWKFDVLTRDVVVEAPCGRIIFCSCRDDDEQVIPDARLIAAAPELLELALYVAGDSPDYGHMHGLAVAAVSKATGQ